MPAEGLPTAPRDEVLTFEDIVAFVTVAAQHGISNLRITGGEPLLRRQLPSLIASLNAIPGIDDIAMTTNALLLDKHASALAKAGLSRLNISLDSRTPERFEKMTRRKGLPAVWRGIEAATAAGLVPIRVNTLLLAGTNDDEVDDWVQFTRDNPIDVRFMELMPIGEGAALTQAGEYANLANMRDALINKHGLQPGEPKHGNGPARYWRAPGALGRLGFITPVSDPYCDTCTRMRLTSTGDLRPCLAHVVQVSARDAIRSKDPERIAATLIHAAAIKPRGHQWQSGQITAAGMSALGG